MAETAIWSDYYITKAGRNLRQLCIAESKKPVFTRAVIGTGKPSGSIDDMTELATYAKDVIIKKSYAIEENHLCIIRVDNSEYTQDVFMSEVGIYAKSEDQNDKEEILYGYAHSLDGYILIPMQTSSTNRKIYEITLDTHLSSTSDIQIIYDSSSLFASHMDLDDLLESLNASQVDYSNSSMAGIVNTKEALDTLNENKANVSIIKWFDFVLASGVSASPTQPARYRKEENVVYIEGWVKGATIGSVFTNLPVGFRPGQSLNIEVAASIPGATTFNAARIIISTGGAIAFHGAYNPELYNSGGASIVASFTATQ